MHLSTDTMELRGIQSKVSQKTNKAYYVLLCEDVNTTVQYRFICKDFNVIPQGLKKGEMIVLRLYFNSYKDFEVKAVEKVG